MHGLDYKGNLCGDEKSSPNVKAFDLQYWVNPNQLYQSGLRDARSICLRNCPTPGNNTISWVCDYPDGSMRNLSIADWSSRNYDYFELLTPDQITSSKNLRGPCYPVLFLSTNGMLRSLHISVIHISKEDKFMRICIGRKLQNVRFVSIRKGIDPALMKSCIVGMQFSGGVRFLLSLKPKHWNYGRAITGRRSSQGTPAPAQ